MNTTTTDTIHRFEAAGLGKAPFRFAGMTESVFQACQGAPIKPGGSCDYCGEGIRYVCAIRSADGRTFKVGTDCAARTGDAGLSRKVDAAKVALDRSKRRATAAGVLAKIEAALADEAVVAALASLPHPLAGHGGRFAASSRLEWARWMLANAGAKGRAEVWKFVAEMAPAVVAA